MDSHRRPGRRLLLRLATPSHYRTAGAASLIVLILTGAAPAQAQPEPLLRGSFAMAGRVTVAKHVRGERPGQTIRRGWVFASACPYPGPCSAVALTRPRAGGTDRIVLALVGEHRYAGRGSFSVPVSCAGRRFVRGGLATYSIVVAVVGAQAEQGVTFASAITASYVNPRRVNRTRCAGFIGHDAAVYAGGPAAGLPPPPQAGFSSTQSAPPGLGVAFADRSTIAAGGAPIVARRWDFGDPSSGAANTATDAAPGHAFTAAGTYTVVLAVTDAYGLSSSTSQTVTVA